MCIEKAVAYNKQSELSTPLATAMHRSLSYERRAARVYPLNTTEKGRRVNLAALALACTNAALILAAIVAMSKRSFGPITLFFGSTGLLLVFRPIIIATGIHGLWPAFLFVDTSRSNAAMLDSQFMVTAWILVAACGVAASNKLRVEPWNSSSGGPLADRQLFLASLFLFGLAATATIPLWIQFGGPTALTAAFKTEKVTTLNFLRLFPLVGSMFAVASVLSLMQNAVPGQSKIRYRAKLILRLSIFVVVAYFSFSWGARDAPVFGSVALLLGRLNFSKSRLPRRAQYVVAIMLIMSLVFGLRIARDTAIQGQTFDAVSDENLVGQISVASNLTMFDALTLVVRDGPPGGTFNGGSDFVDAVRNSIPLIPATAEPTPNVSIQVAQVYLPNRENGWPVTALGDWYVNFGFPGVLLGGAVSGFVVGMFARKTSLAGRDPAIYAISVFIMGGILYSGVWLRTINAGFQLSVAIALTIFASRRLPVRTQSQTHTDQRIGHDAPNRREPNRARA